MANSSIHEELLSRGMRVRPTLLTDRLVPVVKKLPDQEATSILTKLISLALGASSRR